MKLRLADKVEVKGKRVILRVALDVHYQKKNGQLLIDDDARIRAIIPSIKDLQSREAKVILMSWLQRPGGKPNPEMSLAPVGSRLTELLGESVHFLDDCIGKKIQAYIAKAPPRSVILLENVRFHAGEAGESGVDINYAKALAANGDIFVNDAFAQAHRDVASITGIPQFLPSYAGPLLAKEVNALSQITENPSRPLVAIIGGAKISDKIKVIKKFLETADHVLIGGALANTILKAKGLAIGKSLVENEMMNVAKELPLTSTHLHVPVDVVTASAIANDVPTSVKAVGGVGDDEYILDIGPDTLKLFEMIIQKAKMVVWGGPMGYFELAAFARGTREIAKIICRSGAISIVGGGETIEALAQSGCKDKITFISTGGGAMLEFLEGKMLPGIKPLIEKII